MPFELTVSFCNAMAVKLMEEKRACFMAEDHPDKRSAIKQSHLELSELCMTFIAAAINPLESRKLAAESAQLDHDLAVGVLPSAARFGAVLQMHNDMTDLVKDMRDELATGMVAPNSMIADVAAKGGLTPVCRFHQHGKDASANPCIAGPVSCDRQGVLGQHAGRGQGYVARGKPSVSAAGHHPHDGKPARSFRSI